MAVQSLLDSGCPECGGKVTDGACESCKVVF